MHATANYIPQIPIVFEQTQYATLEDGLRLAYADSGQNSSQTLLLIHGIFDHKGTWRSLVEHLTDVRCVAPDLLGHGQSDRPSLVHLPPEQRYSPNMQADYVAHLVEHLGIESIVLGGSSLGGGIALRLFLDYPAIRRRTQAIILSAAAGYRQPLPGYIREMGGWLGSLLKHPITQAISQKTGLLSHGARRSVARCFYDARAIPPALVEETLSALEEPNAFGAYQLAARNIMPPDLDQFSDRLSEIDVPTLIFWGREDRVISPLSALRFSKDIPDTQLHLFDRCGHAPHIECARGVANYLNSFLKQPTASD